MSFYWLPPNPLDCFSLYVSFFGCFLSKFIKVQILKLGFLLKPPYKLIHYLLIITSNFNRYFIIPLFTSLRSHCFVLKLDIAINFYDLDHYCTLFLHWSTDFSFLFINHILYLESFFTDCCAPYSLDLPSSWDRFFMLLIRYVGEDSEVILLGISHGD